jgi:precorrin-6B methylase 1
MNMIRIMRDKNGELIAVLPSGDPVPYAVSVKISSKRDDMPIAIIEVVIDISALPLFETQENKK